MMSKMTAVASSPNGNGINIWWMGCPRALALLSMFLILLLLCKPTARVCPRVGVNLKEPSRRTGPPPCRGFGMFRGIVRVKDTSAAAGCKAFSSEPRPPESCYTRPQSYSIPTDEGAAHEQEAGRSRGAREQGRAAAAVGGDARVHQRDGRRD